MKPITWIALTTVLGALGAGCEPTTGGDEETLSVGQLAMALALPPDSELDVAGVHFEIIDAEGNIQTRDVLLEAETLPDSASEALGGRQFADAFIVLNVGSYTIEATPLKEDGSPSDQCGLASGGAEISEGVTTEIFLVSSCNGEGSGALDVAVVLNQGPFIEDVTLGAGKFACVGEAISMSATASDPDEDELQFVWGAVEAPAGVDNSQQCLAWTGSEAAFAASVPGRYEILLMVSDGLSTAPLRFPLYFSDCDVAPECPGDPVATLLPAPEHSQGLCTCDGIPVCGNGVLESGEDCDPPDGVSCNDDCTLIGALNPAFSSDPPGITRATIERLAAPTSEGNTLLRVSFDERSLQRVGSALTFKLDADQLVTLRDLDPDLDNPAGDNLFTAVMPIDENELAKRQSFMQAGLQRSPRQPLFDGREQLPDQPVPQPFAFEQFVPGMELPIEFFGFRAIPTSGGGASPTMEERTLMITDTTVLDDPTRAYEPCMDSGAPNGVWSFQHLVTNIANTPSTGVSPEAFTRSWLESWLVNQTVSSGDVAPARPNIATIISGWESVSGVGPGGTLDLNKSPFRLLAIVNRVDLGDNPSYGDGNAGEGRFVFGMVDPLNPCGAPQFVVIFEYAVPLTECLDIKQYACDWQSLDGSMPGTPSYNDALELLTESFVQAGLNPAQPPNDSAISQIRTNEIFLAGPWELREFRLQDPLDPSPGFLEQVTIKQNPVHQPPDNVPHPDTYNLSAELALWIALNDGDIAAEAHEVPDTFLGQPFLAAGGRYNFNMFFDGPGGAVSVPDRDVRHKFSLNTCTGCHAGETGTAFTHVKPRFPGAPTPLSGFLTGITVNDPADGAPSRTFDDLARRELVVDAMCNQPCFMFFMHEPVKSEH